MPMERKKFEAMRPVEWYVEGEIFHPNGKVLYKKIQPPYWIPKNTLLCPVKSKMVVPRLIVQDRLVCVLGHITRQIGD